LQQITNDLETTLDNMDQGLMVIAKDRTVPICNRRAVELLDLPEKLMACGPKWDEVLAYQWQANEFDRASPALQDQIHRTALLDGPLVYDRERPNGCVLEVRTTPLPGGEAVRTYTDITDRKRAEQRIDYLAHHDGLTGLANRALLADRLAQAIAHADRGGTHLATLALDLDHFKEVNDTLGHAAGDYILREVAKRLLGVVRATDTVARIGGDEFVIIQTDVGQPSGAVELARRIIQTLSDPFEFSCQRIDQSTSVGIALYPADGGTADLLLRSADVALYRAKVDRGVFRLFEPGMDQRLRERRELEHELRHAIGTNQLTLHFQPQVTCETGAVTGFEALMRWHHPTHGWISPETFIPIAEERGLIEELGAWALEDACSTAMTWLSPLRIAVNLSAAQFRSNRLPEIVADTLSRTGLPATRLELEITETLLIHDPEQALTALEALKAMGVHIALDDFGTGYSSLSYLRRFPFDRIKIDKSFVQALQEDPATHSIVEAILAMGRSLNMAVTAEGVETEQQLAILRGQNCLEAQGFLAGRPICSDQIPKFLEASRNEEFPLATLSSK
jgi:diguanylate cyclase (GGDEF)-like protein